VQYCMRFTLQRPPLFQLSQQQSATSLLNEPWERLSAHLCKQCHCIRSVPQRAFENRFLWLYLYVNACVVRAGPSSEALNLCSKKQHFQYDLQKMHFQRGPTASAATTVPSSVLLLLVPAPNAGVTSVWLTQCCYCRHKHSSSPV